MKNKNSYIGTQVDAKASNQTTKAGRGYEQEHGQRDQAMEEKREGSLGYKKGYKEREEGKTKNVKVRAGTKKERI